MEGEGWAAVNNGIEITQCRPAGHMECSELFTGQAVVSGNVFFSHGVVMVSCHRGGF